jgi:TRAP-type C4-dicarboxylate transport system permease large subunit
VIFVVALFWLAVIGLPLFALFGAASLVLFLDSPGGSWEALATDVFGAKLGDSPTLMILPLLAFTGCLLAETSAPLRLRALARAWLGWMPLGLAVVTWLACALLTTLSTSTAVSALAAWLLPGIVRLRRRDRETSVEQRDAEHVPHPPACVRSPFVAADAWRALADAKWELALPVVLIASHALGSLRWHEAAALGGLCALLVATAVRRDLQLKHGLPRVAGATLVIVGAILAVVVTAIGFNAWLLQADLPNRLLSWLAVESASPLAFVLAINALLIGVSAASGVYSALLLVVPLAMPFADHYHVDPYQLAVVFLLNAELARFIWRAPARPQARAAQSVQAA